MQVAKYFILLAVIAGLLTGAYLKGSTDKQAQVTAKYVKELESVQIQNQKLAEQVALKESEIAEKAFEYEEAIDSYVANVRIKRERVFIKAEQTSLPKNESAECRNDVTDKVEISSRVLEAATRLTRDYNRAVKRLMLCQEFVKQNLESVNSYD